MAWWVLFATGWIVASVWAFAAVRIVRFLRESRLETRGGEFPEPPEWPKVSVVVPARDEAKRIEEALRSLAAQEYPDLEVIAVDDRSRDATGAILDRLAAEDPRLRAVHVRELPAGWLGKCHALQEGAGRSTGELLLFTDGDVVFAPDTLRLAVRYLLGRRLDHLALLPGLSPGGYWEDAAKTYFAMLFLLGVKAWGAGSPSKNVYVGIGAFNLLRRSAYEAVGRHEAIRLEVADDLLLGKRIKQAGFRQEALLALDHLRLRWQEGVGGFVRGLEKNGFASIGYSIPFLLLITGLVALYYGLPYAAALAFRDARVSGYALAILLMHGLFGYFGSYRRYGWLLAPSLPVAAFLYLYSLWRSAVLTLWRGGVLWRDTFYPLEVLRPGGRRRGSG